MFKWMLAKQYLSFRRKHGIYLGTELLLFLKVLNCQSFLFIKIGNILSYGWQEKFVSLCSHPILVLYFMDK